MSSRGGSGGRSLVRVNPINLLAIDTSTDQGALALVTATGSVHTAAPDPAQRHGRNLIPAIRDLLRSAGLSPGDLDGIAVGLGPGSYTGLRIGLTAAKTLAYATGKPLAGLDSLEVIAGNAPVDALRVSVIADAQRGDIYAADFARAEPMAPLTRTLPTRVESLSEWSARLSDPTYVLGPVVERLAASLPSLAITAPPAANRPIAQNLLEVALRTWLSGRRDPSWFLEPVYLRKSAAEEQWARRTQ